MRQQVQDAVLTKRCSRWVTNVAVNYLGHVTKNYHGRKRATVSKCAPKLYLNQFTWIENGNRTKNN